MKKLTALLLAVVMIMGLAACGTSKENSDVKIGIILIGDENVGYDSAHIAGIKAAASKLGIKDSQLIWKYNIEEDETCYDTATDLVEQGCTYIFSDSYGHQSYIQQTASENPDVTFVSMTGDTAATSGLSNLKNAFNDTYQSRYVSGVVAGMKLKELIEDGKITDANKNADGTIKIGYVGAFPYAEVVSGYTAFYLGVKSIVSNVQMDVSYTNSWLIYAEAEAANALYVLRLAHHQHADSTAPSAVRRYESAHSFLLGLQRRHAQRAPYAALTRADD